ncbi:MAG TPA: hypothetical protein VGE98_17090 [Thermoanaerobaculia bacterium]
MATQSTPDFVVCVQNEGYPASLESRKIYRVLPDGAASARGYLRIVDESGEDYLYEAARFVPMELSPSLQDALKLAG